MRLYIYIYISFIKRLPLRLNEYPNTVNGETPVSLNKVGPTCYSQCDLVVFFLIRSCPYHYCVYSVVRHYSYICQFFPLAFFILFCRSLLFFSCVEAWCSTQPDTVYFVHILAMTTQYHDFFTSITQLLIPQVHCAFTCNLVVHWGFSFLFFLY